jgi:hypothetical protein
MAIAVTGGRVPMNARSSDTRGSPHGKTRVCPHCKSVILDSAAICPVCKHHLRFGSGAIQVEPKQSALHVQGTIKQPATSSGEYSVIVSIRNGEGREIKRQIIDVGAMLPDEQRTFDLQVEISKR